MNILLTGSSGFIGSYLKKNIDIRTIVIRKNEIDNCKSHYKIDNLTGTTCWNNAFNSIDCIIHLAGLAHSNKFTDSDYYSVNTQGTLKLAVDAAKAGVKRFVFVSSIGVNGSSTEKEKPFSYNHKFEPHNVYAQSKLDAELGLKKLLMRPV